MEIWKYTLAAGVNRIEMPRDAVILSAKKQGTSLVLWAKVDPDVPTDVRLIWVALTGEELRFKAKAAKFIDTVLMHDSFVVHVFDCGDL